MSALPAVFPSPTRARRPLLIRVEHRGDGSVTEYEFLTSPVRIGRNPINDLSLPYSFVSSWHGVIRFDEHEAHFFDLGSTNGTSCDGAPVRPGEAAAIEATLRLRIGDVDLVLSRGEAPRADEPGASRRRWMQASASRPDRAGAIDTDDPAARDTPRPHQTAHVPLGLVHQMIAALRPSFEAAQAARAQYERELREHLAQLPIHLRAPAEHFVRREFGDARGPHASAGADSPLARFCAQVVPELAPPAADDEATALLDRIRDVLEACARGVVELQNGQEQFGQEMGVRAVKEFTPLHTASSANNVLEYLLDWRHGDPARIQELVGVFADAMIHQVAVINGVVEGGRALVDELSPAELERRAGGGWGKAGAWKALVKRHAELTRDDRALLDLLFGPEFARAYAEVGGERAQESNAP